MEAGLANATSLQRGTLQPGQRPYEKNNLASAEPDKVAALQQRVNDLSKSAAKPLFLVDQMKVIMKNMKGQPVLPGEERFDSGDLILKNTQGKPVLPGEEGFESGDLP